MWAACVGCVGCVCGLRVWCVGCVGCAWAAWAAWASSACNAAPVNFKAPLLACARVGCVVWMCSGQALACARNVAYYSADGGLAAGAGFLGSGAPAVVPQPVGVPLPPLAPWASDVWSPATVTAAASLAANALTAHGGHPAGAGLADAATSLLWNLTCVGAGPWAALLAPPLGPQLAAAVATVAEAPATAGAGEGEGEGKGDGVPLSLAVQLAPVLLARLTSPAR